MGGRTFSGLEPHNSATSSPSGCNFSNCQTFVVPVTETIDRLHFGTPVGGPVKCRRPDAATDMLKIHAQDQAMEVLRGAREALKVGFFCTISAILMQSFAMNELVGLLPDFTIFVHSNMSKILLIAAWHNGFRCLNNPAVIAMRALLTN